MKRLEKALHLIGVALIPGYWIWAMFVYAHHKIKHQPVKLKEVEKDIKEKVEVKLHKAEEKIEEKLHKNNKKEVYKNEN